MIIANENTKYQLKQITTEIIYILNTELKQRTHYENDRISISHIPIINIFRGQRIGINTCVVIFFVDFYMLINHLLKKKLVQIKKKKKSILIKLCIQSLLLY